MKKIIVTIFSFALLFTTYFVSEGIAHAKINQSEKWNNQKILSKNDQKKLLARYEISGGSATYYAHKNLYKGLFNERYLFKFEPNSYAWHNEDYLKYDVKLKSSNKIMLKKIKVTVGKKSKTINLHYPSYYDGFASAEAGKSNEMQAFLKKNIRMSKKATVTYYTKTKKITKTLNAKQKEVILDNITLHTKVLH
ncbi:hypothetical protein ACWV26_02785 [Rummeliibacillus sp. JY-2-4R]